MCLGKRALQTSRLAASLGLDLETKIFDDVVGQQLPAHRLHALPRLMLAGRVEADLDVLADADVGHLPEAERGQALLDGDALRVLDDRLGGHDHARDHRGSPIYSLRAPARTTVFRPGGDMR